MRKGGFEPPRPCRRQPLEPAPGEADTCYDHRVITDLGAYARLCEQERWEALRAMSFDDSIVVLEALLGSELLDIGVFPDDDHPVGLARSLGIPPDRVHRAA